MAKLSLTFKLFEGHRLIREQTLVQGVIKIGKVPSAHLQIPDDTVSRMHAIVEVTRDEVALIDLGSTGGTFVNGQKINKVMLRTGDEIQIGKTRMEVAITPVAEAVPVEVPAPTPPPIPAPRPAPAPVAVAAAATPTRPFLAAAQPEEILGARAVEVAAMFGDSVVGVKHCMDPRGGKVTGATWGMLGVGALSLLASAIAFYLAVDTAAFNKGGLEYHTRVLHKPEWSYRPRTLSVAVDFVAFGALGIALGCLTAGLARVRRERRSPFYRIGTAPGVEQPLDNAPSPAFPLVAPAGDDFVFNFAPGIEGELVVDNTTTPLAELAAQGRAQASRTTAGAIEVPIPNKGRIRARAGQTTFLVTAVAKPRPTAATGFAGLERRTLAYVGGSLAAHLAVVLFLQTIPVDDSGLNVVMDETANTTVEARTSQPDDYVEKQPVEDGDDTGQRGNDTMKLAGEEGAAGKPNAENINGHIAIKDNKVEQRLSREQAIKDAQTAGVLGSIEAIRGGIAALTATDPFSSGFDVDDIYGPLIGAAGEGRGNFGMGVHGFGAGGGCLGGPCGLVGVGSRYNTISDGKHAGGNYWGPGGLGGVNGRRHRPETPPLVIGTPTIGGGLDKEIIKRYIKRNINTFSYCYEKQLLAKPGIEGVVDSNFLIAPDGTVQTAAAKGFDSEVASCVAGVLKNIAFPKPTDGGNVQVHYPFTFHATGAH